MREISILKKRILQFLDYKGIKKSKFYEKTGISNGILSQTNGLSEENLLKFLEIYQDCNKKWLLSGEGSMINEKSHEIKENKIPLFDDVRSIGGHQELAAMDAQHPSELINVGDWFRDASAVIRHYGDSMSEYPSGCLIAVKEVKDKRLLVWGRNYCIETTEFRVTKRLQACSDDSCVMAYSTNGETSSDGALIYAPMMIPKDAIVRIYMVLGCVMVEDGNHVHLSR